MVVGKSVASFACSAESANFLESLEFVEVFALFCAGCEDWVCGAGLDSAGVCLDSVCADCVGFFGALREFSLFGKSSFFS